MIILGNLNRIITTAEMIQTIFSYVGKMYWKTSRWGATWNSRLSHFIKFIFSLDNGLRIPSLRYTSILENFTLIFQTCESERWDRCHSTHISTKISIWKSNNNVMLAFRFFQIFFEKTIVHVYFMLSSTRWYWCSKKHSELCQTRHANLLIFLLSEME